MTVETIIALDRASVRRIDHDGHLHVEMANMSKANVCPYRGSEIPGYETLGLDANRIYNLLRDPEELAKGAETLNGKPLLDLHIPVGSEDHPNDRVVGTIGSDAAFDGTYLKNSMTVWVGDSIRRIESGEQRELSCGYHYRADMTPGTHNGVAYDGVMRDIAFNHVALVSKGRAGSDVVVGDSCLEMSMLKSRLALLASGAVLATVRPRLAQGSKLALDSAFEGVTRDNFADKRDEVAAAVVEIVKPLLASDQELAADDVLVALDAAASSDDDEDDDMGEDEKPPTPPKKKAKKMAGDEAPKPIAFDEAAIRREAARDAVAHIRALDAAERAVLPHIGVLAERPDTEAGIYKLALDAKIADGTLPADALTNVPPAHFKSMVAMLSVGAPAKPVVAMDAADDQWLTDMGLVSSAKVRA